MRSNAHEDVHMEEHFNSLQANIRNIASGWLLAALGAIAYLLQADAGGKCLVPQELLISVVAVMGIVGICVLWIQDQLVYHRLLNSVFLLGLKMEYDDHSIPPVRTMMMIFSEKAGMAGLLRLYYLIPMYVLAGIGTISSVIYCSHHLYVTYISCAIALFIVSISVPLWVTWKGRSMEQFHERAKGFDYNFVEYLKEKRFEERLSKF